MHFGFWNHFAVFSCWFWLGESQDLRHRNLRQTTGRVFYLNQNGNPELDPVTNRPDGLSTTTAFQDVDEAIDALAPGDTLYIMGELNNPSYNPDYTFQGNVDDPYLWHAENTIRIHNLHGTPDAYITITSYDKDSQMAVIRGDGGNLMRITDSSFLRIEYLELYGQVEHIPLATAKALQFVYKDENGEIQYRVDPQFSDDDEQIASLTLPVLGSNIPRVSYTDTRGLYMSNSHHVTIKHNHIHHVPGTGLRVAESEFVDIQGNEIHDCSRKSYSGTHALVVTKTSDNLPAQSGWDDYRVLVIGNLVHHNYNEIYSWVGTKSFIHPRIDEGKGISLQRNQMFSNGGRILVANNVAYWNGYSGIHSNDGDNIDFIGNTAYMNSYTNTVTYANGEQSGNNVGISMSGGTNCRIVNNIAYIDTSWRGFPISVTSDMVDDIILQNNLVWGVGKQDLKLDPDAVPIEMDNVQADPLFGDPDMGNFQVQESSPASGKADHQASLPTDFFGNIRGENPTAGAIEYVS